MNNMEHNEELERMIQEMEDQKEFMPNPERENDVALAFDLISELFPPEAAEIEEDPTQFGTFLIHIEVPSLVLMDEKQIEYFSLVAGIVDNLEINKTEKGISIDAVIYNAFLRRNSTKNTDAEIDEI